MISLEEKLTRGVSCHQKGQIEEAVSCYQEILEEDPNHSEALHLLGVCAMQIGKFDQCIELIEKALAIRPDTPAYYNNLAAAYHHKTDLDQSEKYYRKSIALQPNFVDAYNNLGNLYREKKDLRKAKEQFQKALSLNPGMSSVLERLSAVEEELKKLEGTEETVPVSESSTQTVDGVRERIDSLFETGKKHVLHVGCGGPNPEKLDKRFRTDDWKEIRLDINKDVFPDIIGTMTDMSIVEENSVDAIWSSHNIEHLYAHEVPIALGEFYRVLKPGGFALITLPDLQQIAEYIIADRLDEVVYESPIGPITGVDFIFGHGESIAKGNHYMAHLTGFTATSLNNCLTRAGFVRLNSWFTPFNLWVEAYKP